MKKGIIFFICLTLVCNSGLFSQQARVDSKVIEKTQVSTLKEFSIQQRTEENANRRIAVETALKKNWAIRKVLGNGKVLELVRLDKSGRPVYYVTTSSDAAQTISTHKVWPGGDSYLNLTGAGHTIGMWDGGGVLTTHQEFGGRVTQRDYAPDMSDHATGVASMLIAKGADASARGMAYEARVDAYDLENLGSEFAHALSEGLLVSNHSWAYASGWVKGVVSSDPDKWVWLGDPSIDASMDYKFGFYGEVSQSIDQLLGYAPYHLAVIGAGNDRVDRGPEPGEAYYLYNMMTGDFSLSTAPRAMDGPYDCINMAATGKNLLTVGAIDDIPGGYKLAQQARMSTFSSWGPTDDGRIKPDICGNGVNVYTAWGQGNDSYAVNSGTSLAAPNVAASLLLLQQHYGNLHNNAAMTAATLKGLIIHTADEAGYFPGPDYNYGWGVLNTAKAAEVISNHGLEHVMLENTLQDGATYSVKVKSNGGRPLYATLVWTDAAGNPVAPQLNPSALALVNDLDMRIEGMGRTFSPWVLNPAIPSFPATAGDNFRDNVEKIYIPNPGPGEYTITIRHKGNLAGGAQNFSLFISEITGSLSYCSGTTVHSTYSGSISDGSGIAAYSENASCQWLIKPEGATSIELEFHTFATEKLKDWVKVYDGSSTSAPLLGAFSGTNVPRNLRSSGGVMLVEFVTDNSINADGWSASYTATALSDSYCNAMTTLTAPSGNFSDGSGVNNYRDNTLCKWLIQPDGAEAITLDFTYFDVSDVVYVFDGSATTDRLIGAFTGKDLPPSITSSGGSLLVYFVSNNETTSDGWMASYRTSCRMPSNLAVWESGSVSATVKWDAGLGANAYIVEYSPVNNPNWLSVIATTNHYTLTGLWPSTAYEWRVRSVCGDNQVTAWSSNHSFTTQGAIFCGPPIHLNLDQVSSNDAWISWTPSPSGVKYWVSYKADGYPETQPMVSYLNSIALSNLMPNTNYRVVVRTQCAEGVLSDYTGQLTFTTQSGCGYPVGLTVEPGPTQNTATLRWHLISELESQRYILAWRKNVPEGVWFNVTLDASINNYVLNGLAENEDYEAHIRSRCGMYASGWSPMVHFTNNGLLKSTKIGGMERHEVSIFPNPNHGQFEIKFEAKANTQVKLSVVDLAGKEVHTSQFQIESDNASVQLNLQDLPKGIYLIHGLLNDDTSFKSKVIIN